MPDEPRSVQTASVLDELRAIVVTLEHGARLPAERMLAERWGVARMTVRQAIATLAREGLVRTVHGRGTMRAPGPIALTVGLGSFADAVAEHGMTPTTRLLGLSVDSHPPAAATEFLGLDRRHRARKVRRLRLGDDVPLALEQTWLPNVLVGDLTNELATGSLYHYLAKRSLLPDSGQESITADFPDEAEARLLDMPTSRPVLRLTRRSLHGETPVEYAEAVFPSDRHELSFPLDRTRFTPS